MTVSANTDTLHDTYVNTGSTYCVPPLKTTAFSPFTLLYTCTAYDIGTPALNKAVLSSPDCAVILTVATSFVYTQAAVLKDSLILGASRYGVARDYISWQLTVSGSLMTASQITTGALTYYCQGAEDDAGSFIVCADGLV